MRIFSRSFPRARIALRARLTFESVRLKYAKNYACSADLLSNNQPLDTQRLVHRDFPTLEFRIKWLLKHWSTL